MEKTIDSLIEKHEYEKYTKYILVCSVSEFKKLQELMVNKYKIKEGKDPMWRHLFKEGQKGSVREGTVKFKNFELNAYCSSGIIGGSVITKMNELPLAYMNMFKNSK